MADGVCKLNWHLFSTLFFSEVPLRDVFYVVERNNSGGRGDMTIWDRVYVCPNYWDLYGTRAV